MPHALDLELLKPQKEAAALLKICRTQLWRLGKRGKIIPMRSKLIQESSCRGGSRKNLNFRIEVDLKR